MGQGVEFETDEALGVTYILDKTPVDGSLIQKVKCSTKHEIDSKIETLKEKQKKWKSTPLAKRVETLREALEAALDGKEEELTQLISKEMGKTLDESKEEVDEVVEAKEDMLDLVHEANKPQIVDNAMIVRDPLGVVAIISPWNFPAGEIMLHLVPALVAGNAVIVKPSEVTPLVGQYLVDQLKEANPDLPIDIAQGGGDVGAMLVSHTDVKSISMTGSSATGKKIMENAATELKRLILELGGKDPMVVFKDADLELAAKDAVECSTCNAGQVCCSVERIYVDSSVKDKFEKLCVKECEKVKAGPYDNDDTTMGPMVSREQMHKVKDQVDDAVANGAKILYKGDVLASESQVHGGNYYPATIVTDLKQDMEISRAETFGPVVAVYEFDGSEEKAIELSNDTPYGLSASVYTADLEKGTRVASAISAGQVGVNAWGLAHAPIKCPWIGHKESGHGFHSGQEGYRQFSVPKSIVYVASEVGGGGEKAETKSVADMMKTATFEE